MADEENCGIEPGSGRHGPRDEDDDNSAEEAPELRYTEGRYHNDDTVSDGAIDIRGRPARKSATGNWKACWLIFGCEVCERVAFYAISSNLVTYLTDELHEDIAVSAKNVNNWSGTTYLTPLIGAFIADAYLGRFWTLATFSCGYLLSLVFMTLAVSLHALRPPRCAGDSADGDRTCPKSSGIQVGVFYSALYLMAFGGGGIKANVCSFAGDQFDEGDSAEKERKMSFPNWWFTSINCGSMVSVSVLAYVQENAGWTWCYGTAAVVTGIATLLFLSGTSTYRNHTPVGSPVIRISQVVVAAFRKWKFEVPEDRQLLYEAYEEESMSPRSRRLRHTEHFLFLDKAAVVSVEHVAQFSMRRGQLINPWILCTVSQVEEVKLLLHVFPIWMTNLAFAAVFAQVGTLFISQGATMDRHVGRHFHVPAASFALFVTLTIVLLLPVYDRYFVSMAKRLTGDSRGLSLLQRIGVGQVISTLSIASAALVERKRLKVARENGLRDDPRAVLPISIFWLLPQYVLTGVCEVFISVGQLEFFYDQAPDSMKSVGTALYLSTVAVGMFISSLLVTFVSRYTDWISNNLNRSHLDYFYWLLTGISTLNFLLYLFFAYRYTYKLNVNGINNNHIIMAEREALSRHGDAELAGDSSEGGVGLESGEVKVVPVSESNYRYSSSHELNGHTPKTPKPRRSLSPSSSSSSSSGRLTFTL